MNIKNLIKNKLSNEIIRKNFVACELEKLPKGSLLLDAGCGSQQYRPLCDHLTYHGQDFGQYDKDESPGFTAEMGGGNGYKYGKLDYVGDIWNIKEKDQTFDAILCTEVFEHIPYPNETVKEFSRLLKPGGKLILTLPSNCLRHMDPYYFYSGFSNHWIAKILAENFMKVEIVETVGDYYSWLAVEVARTMKNHSLLSALLLLPAFIWYALKKPTIESKSTLCMGYHVVASRLDNSGSDF